MLAIPNTPIPPSPSTLGYIVRRYYFRKNSLSHVRDTTFTRASTIDNMMQALDFLVRAANQPLQDDYTLSIGLTDTTGRRIRYTSEEFKGT